MASDDELRRSLAHIEVTRLGSDKGGRGTGVPVGPGRVLTALHVVAGTVSKVEVCFPDLYGDRRYSATVIWPTDAGDGREVGDGVLDAALLQLKESPPGLKSVPLGSRVCTEHEEWWGRGFPRAAKRAPTAEENASTPEVWPYTGKVAGAPVQRANGTWSDLALHVDGEPDQRDGWKGASGAPVLIGRELHGIVRSVKAEWKERLLAVSVRALLAAPGFTVALGGHGAVDEWRRHRASQVEALVTRFSREKEIVEQLSLLTKLSEEPGALADGLMHLPVERFCGLCNVVHDKLAKAGRREAARAVFELLQELAPLVVDSGLVELVLRSGEGAIVELHAKSPTLAALVAAAADKQPLRARMPTAANDMVKAASQVDPDGDETGKGGARVIVDRIREQLLARNVNELFLRGLDSSELDQKLREYLEDQADPMSAREPFRYFYAYAPNEVGRQVARELNSRFPLIRTFELHGTDPRGEELKLTRALVDILLRGGYSLGHAQPTPVG